MTAAACLNKASAIRERAELPVQTNSTFVVYGTNRPPKYMDIRIFRY